MKTALMLLGMSLLLAGCAKETAQASPAFAQCLSASGAVMYGTSWCSHCQNQKSMFGPVFSHISYVDCEDEPKRCDAAGVRGFPTWIIKNQSYPGEQTLGRLAALTGCVP